MRILFLRIALALALIWAFNCHGQPGFAVDPGFRPAVKEQVRAFALQPDGKIVVSGYFPEISRESFTIARLHPDGTLDPTFATSPGAADRMALQPDGRIIIGESLGTDWSARLRRLNADGNRDGTFNDLRYSSMTGHPAIVFDTPETFLWEACRFLLADGSSRGCLQFGTDQQGLVLFYASGGEGAVLVGISSGSFFDPRHSIEVYRVVADKAEFKARIEFGLPGPYTGHPQGLRSRLPSAVATQNDGKLLIAGAFTNVNGVARSGLVRLHRDGTVDETFRFGLHAFSESHGIRQIVPQPDGKVVLGGSFISEGASGFAGLVKLNHDGSFENSYVIGSPQNEVTGIALLPEGGILIGSSSGLVAIQPVPKFRSVQILPGFFSATIGGQSGWTYRIETSTDLVNWTLLRELLSAGAVTEFVDLDSSKLGQRFYRASLRL